MIIMIPIEPIPMRYSEDWLNWFTDYFHNKNIDFITIQGQELTKGIEQGRFLDCIGTNYYKSSQLMSILEKIKEGKIKKGDTLFFLDIWFPGIEQIKYTSDLLNLNIKIMGCLHAGAYDPNDMLYQKGLGSWAVHFEHSLFSIVDFIFVATHYHKDLIIKSRSVDEDKIKVTGFPFLLPQDFPIEIGNTNSTIFKKKNQIVFPHRLDPEKNPKTFISLIKNYGSEFKDWSWIMTAEVAKTKKDYYNILKESKIAVSLSDQETWGIAMIEAVYLGCFPLVPNKLSYSEMYLEEFKYDDLFHMKSILKDMTENYMKWLNLLHQQLVFFMFLFGNNSFENIMKYLTGKGI